MKENLRVQRERHTGRKTLLYTNNTLKTLNLLTFEKKRMRFSYAEREAKRKT